MSNSDAHDALFFTKKEGLVAHFTILIGYPSSKYFMFFKGVEKNPKIECFSAIDRLENHDKLKLVCWQLFNIREIF